MSCRSQNKRWGLSMAGLFGLCLGLLVISTPVLSDDPPSVSGTLDAVVTGQRTLVIDNRRYEVPRRVVFNGVEMEGSLALEYLREDDHVMLILRSEGSSSVERINSSHE